MVVVFKSLQGRRIATDVNSIEEKGYKGETILKLNIANEPARYLRFNPNVIVEQALDNVFYKLGEGVKAVNTLNYAKEFFIDTKFEVV